MSPAANDSYALRIRSTLSIAGPGTGVAATTPRRGV